MCSNQHVDGDVVKLCRNFFPGPKKLHFKILAASSFLKYFVIILLGEKSSFKVEVLIRLNRIIFFSVKKLYASGLTLRWKDRVIAL